MCGRYYRRSDKQYIAVHFRLRPDIYDYILPNSNFNITPTTFQPVIRAEKESGERELVLMRWGLVPFFAKSLDTFKGFSTFNARAESIQTSATWREPFKRRRCLVPVDGFFEWKAIDQNVGDDRATTPADGSSIVPIEESPTAKTLRPKQIKKIPFAISLKDDQPFAFAGLWDAWKEPDGGYLQSFSIVTTEANELMAGIHSRMPVILHPRNYDRWLDRNSPPEQPPVDLLRPYDSDAMQAFPCNPLVGNVRNNGPEMLNSA